MLSQAFPPIPPQIEFPPHISPNDSPLESPKHIESLPEQNFHNNALKKNLSKAFRRPLKHLVKAFQKALPS